MKFRVERDAFADAVAFVARSLPSRAPVPVLGGVLLDASDDGTPGLRWLRPDGQPMAGADWDRGAALAILFDAGWLLLVNAGAAPVEFDLPAGDWQLCLSSDPSQDPGTMPRALARTLQVANSSLCVART